MEIFDVIVLALLAFFIVILLLLFNKNTTLYRENKQLKEILAIKDTTIANYEASRVSVTEVIENFSSTQAVMQCIEAGESKASISSKLNLPLSKIELILKFDRLKKSR
ncbi:MAG: sigma-70 family RNA polymerase sigma factor [Sulfurovum sp.]|nr:sigma-70 family RNA polymerase sigma factor [Sulfurovum sp.]